MILFTTIGRGIVKAKVEYDLMPNGEAEVEAVFQMYESPRGLQISKEDSSGMLDDAEYESLCKQCDEQEARMRQLNLESV